METKVTYSFNKIRVSEASLSNVFGSQYFKLFFKVLCGVGLLAFFVILGLSFWPENVAPVVMGLLWLIVFLGTLSVWPLAFGIFLAGQEAKYPISDDKTDLGMSSDFETTTALYRLSKTKFNLGDLLKEISVNHECQFILSEVQADDKFWANFRAGMAGSDFLEVVFGEAVNQARRHDSNLVSMSDIFWGTFSKNENFEKIIAQLELSEADVSNIFFLGHKLYSQISHKKTTTERLKRHSSGVAQNWDAGYTNFLDHFSHNVSASGADEVSIEGRQDIEHEIEDILTKENKNNVVLVGPVGVGKTTLIKELVSKIAWSRSLPSLAFQRVVELDIGAIVAAASNSSRLESVLVGSLNDAVSAGNIILYIQNIESIFAGGTKEGTIDASEIILPYLRNSSLRIIGATTEKDYETYIQAKPELASVFTKVSVEPTDKDTTLRVLSEMSVYMGLNYKLKITYTGVKEIYTLSEKYVTEKEFPGKAVDMMENVCSAARNEGDKIVDKQTVAKLAEHFLNVKISEVTVNEKDILLKLEDNMHARVVGQFTAVKVLADAMRRARTQTKDDKRPLGSFLFMGPTGVGKTELAKTLAFSYFGDESRIIRMDMNEFQDSSAIDRFIGKKAAGSDQLEGGEFVKAVRANPSSIVLLDEIEKANPNVLDLFLQALDEGYITDGMGEKVVLSGLIIIGTSNAGSNTIRQSVAAGEEYESMRAKVMEEVQNAGTFKPEFLNRFDGVVLFSPLSGSEILKVAELMFKGIQADFKNKGYDIELAPGLLEKLAQEGYVPEMGARPMRRVFQDRLENFLAKKMLEDAIPKGEAFVVKIEDLY
jgi:ATP-dependent Clp protease ATP-binding subunit ClpC